MQFTKKYKSQDYKTMAVKFNQEIITPNSR